MRKALARAKGRDALVRINSPGGSVFEGFSMFNQLRQYPGLVDTETDALAASAAALVFLAGTNREMSEIGAQVMIHEAWNFVMMAGNKREMRDFFDRQFALLDRVDTDIAKVISRVSALSEADAMKAMEAETWYSAAEAVDAGIATAITGSGGDPPDGSAGIVPGMSSDADYLRQLKASLEGKS